MRILAFGHRSRTGKDLAARTIVEYVHSRTTCLAAVRPIAGPIKDLAARLFSGYGVRPPEFYDEEPEARQSPLLCLGMTPVQLWCRLGELGREIAGPAYWVEQVLRSLPRWGAVEDVIIIPDVRVPGEIEAIREYCPRSVVVRIDRPGYTGDWPAGLDDELAGYDGWDAVLENPAGMNPGPGDLMKFQRRVLRMFVENFPEIEARRQSWDEYRS